MRPSQTRWEKWLPCPGGLEETMGCSYRPWGRCPKPLAPVAICTAHVTSWPPAYLLFCLPLPAGWPSVGLPSHLFSQYAGCADRDLSAYLSPACLAPIPSAHLLIFLRLVA